MTDSRRTPIRFRSPALTSEQLSSRPAATTGTRPMSAAAIAAAQAIPDGQERRRPDQRDGRRLAILLQLGEGCGAAPRVINEIRSIMKATGADCRLVFVRNGALRPQLAEYLDAICYSEPTAESIQLSAPTTEPLAVAAGIQAIEADAYVLIKADGGDDPRAILDMYRKWQQGYDCVFAVRQHRQKRSRLTSLAKAAYRAADRRCGTQILYNADNFCLLDQQVLPRLFGGYDPNNSLAQQTARLGYRRTLVGMNSPWQRSPGISARTMKHFRTLRGALIAQSRTPVRTVYAAALTVASIVILTLAATAIAALAGASLSAIAAMMTTAIMLSLCPLAFTAVVLAEYTYQIAQHGPASQRYAFHVDRTTDLDVLAADVTGQAASHSKVGRSEVSETDILATLAELRQEAIDGERTKASPLSNATGATT